MGGCLFYPTIHSTTALIHLVFFLHCFPPLFPLPFFPFTRFPQRVSVMEAAEELGRKLREEAGVQKGIDAFYAALPTSDAMVAGRVQTVWEVSCYENQRYYPAIGWTDTLLPGDPLPWSDESGRQAVERYSFTLPPGWRWEGEWGIDSECWASEGHGFRYASSWEADDFHRRHKLTDFVRQRRWVRRRVQVRAANGAFAAAAAAPAAAAAAEKGKIAGGDDGAPGGALATVEALQKRVAALEGILKERDQSIEFLSQA